MDYPGRTIKEGEADGDIVRAIQQQLEAVGCASVDPPGTFGASTKASVKLFQTRHVDAEGNPLKPDGKVGPLTWSALFGVAAVPESTEPASPFLGAVLATAATQVGVLEIPKDSNSGPQVDEYLKRAGVSLALPMKQKPWCCAFVFWCFDETAIAQGRPNPMMKTAGCLDHWNGCVSHGATRVIASRAA